MGWRTRISRMLSLTLLATLMARALAENALHMPQANCEMQSLGGPSWRSGTIGKVSCKCSAAYPSNAMIWSPDRPSNQNPGRGTQNAEPVN